MSNSIRVLSVWSLWALAFPLFSVDNDLLINFSVGRGYYDAAFALELTCNDASARIYYTRDCSIPSQSISEDYRSVITISTTTTIRAIAYANGDTSQVFSHTYLFADDIKHQSKRPFGFPSTWGGASDISADYEMDQEIINASEYNNKIEEAFKSMPSLCLSMSVDDWFDPQTGNYVGYPDSKETREKATSAEFIYNDARQSFGVNCGVQNQGGSSIVNWKVPKQSMRLLFKEMYGPKKLNKNIFQDSEIESINTLVLDATLYAWYHNFDRTQRETSLYFRDQLCSDFQNAMGHYSFHGFYVHLYINGLYWGIYDIHERPDERFMEEYYDTEAPFFDVIKHNYKTVVAGSNDSYLALLSLARAGLTSSSSLEAIQEYLDLPAFIDYMVLNYYLGNFDWAHQNYYAARNNYTKEGYRFYTWDAEHVMRYSDVNYDATKKSDTGGPTEIHAFLKQNSDYRQMFADAFYKHAFNDGVLAPQNFEKYFMKRKNEIDLGIILESARWGDYRESDDHVTYTRDDYWIPEVKKVLNEYIPNRRAVVIDQLKRRDNKLYNDIQVPKPSVKSGRVNKGNYITLSHSNGSSCKIVYTQDGSDPRLSGGGVGGLWYSGAISIEENTKIMARAYNVSTQEWSPLVELLYIVSDAQENIMISEIMYNAEFSSLEFVELYNNSKTDVDLLGIVFSQGISYEFKQKTILPARQTLVLTNDIDEFYQGFRLDAYDKYDKRLSNSGEILLLKNYFGETIDSVCYSDTVPWPVGADGLGASLELRGASLDNALAASWKASDLPFGSPMQYTSLEEERTVKSFHLVICPNPVESMAQVALPSDAAFYKLQVCDVSGQLIEYHLINVAVASKYYRLDCSNYDAGVYIVSISSENAYTSFGKFIVQ